MHYIPKTYYVKFKEHNSAGCWGYAVPYQEGEHKEVPNFASTKATADRWANQDEAFILDNELVSGFELRAASVKDPRGFWQSVDPSVVNHILTHCTVVQGMIQERCIWLRGGDGNNYLAVEGSDLYKRALKATERRLTRVGLRELNRGDLVQLKDGSEVTYYGGFYVRETTAKHRFKRVNEDDLDWSVCWDKRRYVVSKERGGDRVIYSVSSSLHVSGRIEEADPLLTDEEALALVNEAPYHTYREERSMRTIQRFMLDKQPLQDLVLHWDLIPREEWLRWKVDGTPEQRHYLVAYAGKWWLLNTTGGLTLYMMGIETPEEGASCFTYRTFTEKNYYREEVKFASECFDLTTDSVAGYRVYALSITGRKGMMLTL